MICSWQRLARFQTISVWKTLLTTFVTMDARLERNDFDDQFALVEPAAVLSLVGCTGRLLAT